ncbi:MAG: adenylosuccinate lyase, partial [Brachybacterium sp.]
LVTSRLQRDLTDSTTQRNIGPAIGHSLLAIANIRKGLAGLDVDAGAMAADLDGNWEVLGEAVQSVMRTLGVQGVPGLDNPYERLKDLTRGHRVDGEGMREFIGSLGLPEAEQERLLALSPHTYVGYAAGLVSHLDDKQA